MSSRYVRHQITGKLYPISSSMGKSILKQYLVRNMSGGMEVPPPSPPPSKVNVKFLLKEIFPDLDF